MPGPMLKYREPVSAADVLTEAVPRRFQDEGSALNLARAALLGVPPSMVGDLLELFRTYRGGRPNSLILGGPLGWTWQATLDEAHHGSLAGPANAHRHSDLASIGIDDHHERDHALRHDPGGADALSTAYFRTDGSLDFAGVFNPDGDGTRDIGSSTKRWRDLYLTNAINFGGLLLASWRNGVNSEYRILVNTAGTVPLYPLKVYMGLGVPVLTFKTDYDIEVRDASKLWFGADTNLYRSAADVLKTDDNLDALALRIGATEVITSARALQNVTADASIITSGLLSLDRIPTPLTGKSADMVDGAHAGLSDGDVALLPAATQWRVLYRGSSAWELWYPALELNVGDTVLASADETRGTGSTTMVKVKEITVGRYANLRIYFELKAQYSGGYGRIYKNGLPIGTLRYWYSIYGDWRAFTEDITGWQPGDKVQLYICSTNSSYAVNARYFRLKVSDDSQVRVLGTRVDMD